jgi:hypothetical protein
MDSDYSMRMCGEYHSPFDKYPKRYFMGGVEIPEWNALWMLANNKASVASDKKEIGYVRVNLAPVLER